MYRPDGLIIDNNRLKLFEELNRNYGFSYDQLDNLIRMEKVEAFIPEIETEDMSIRSKTKETVSKTTAKDGLKVFKELENKEKE